MMMLIDAEVLTVEERGTLIGAAVRIVTATAITANGTETGTIGIETVKISRKWRESTRTRDLDETIAPHG